MMIGCWWAVGGGTGGIGINAARRSGPHAMEPVQEGCVLMSHQQGRWRHEWHQYRCDGPLDRQLDLYPGTFLRRACTDNLFGACPRRACTDELRTGQGSTSPREHVPGVHLLREIEGWVSGGEAHLLHTFRHTLLEHLARVMLSAVPTCLLSSCRWNRSNTGFGVQMWALISHLSPPWCRH